MIAHVNQPTPTFYDTAPDLQVPPGLEDVVRRCLEKRPEARFQNVDELSAALVTCRDIAPELFESVENTHTVITRKLQRAVTRDRWQRLLPGVVVGLIAAVVGVGIWQLGAAEEVPIGSAAPLPETPEIVRVGPTPSGTPIEVLGGSGAAVEGGDDGEAGDEGDVGDENVGDENVGDDNAVGTDSEGPDASIEEAAGPAERPPAETANTGAAAGAAGAGAAPAGDDGAASPVDDTPPAEPAEPAEPADAQGDGGDKDEAVEELMPSPY